MICYSTGILCRAAGLAVAQRAAEWVGPSVPSLVKHVLDRIGQEEQQSNQEELAGKQLLHCSIITHDSKATMLACCQAC